jgi:hypothetical protein
MYEQKVPVRTVASNGRRRVVLGDAFERGSDSACADPGVRQRTRTSGRDRRAKPPVNSLRLAYDSSCSRAGRSPSFMTRPRSSPPGVLEAGSVGRRPSLSIVGPLSPWPSGKLGSMTVAAPRVGDSSRASSRAWSSTGCPEHSRQVSPDQRLSGGNPARIIRSSSSPLHCRNVARPTIAEVVAGSSHQCLSAVAAPCRCAGRRRGLVVKRLLRYGRWEVAPRSTTARSC